MSTAEDRGFDRTEICGLPTFHGRETGEDLTGILWFRVGRADEPLVRGGITHLVEHLALRRYGIESFGYNATVGGIITSFGATGKPDEVAAFLNEVARALRDLPLDRITHEARVLRAEAHGRGPGVIEEALWLRYGNRGHGTRHLPELFLRRPEPEAVREWADRHFTAGNAALTFSGPPPPGLAMTLPPGPRIPPPPLTEVPNVSWPAWAGVRTHGIGITFVTPREHWISIPIEMAFRRAMRRLRYEQGLVYSVSRTYEVLDSVTAIASLWTPYVPAQAWAVREGLLAQVRALALEGPTPQEMEEFHRESALSIERREVWQDAVGNAANNELVGFPVRSPDELHAELTLLDGATLASRLKTALETSLFTIPFGEAPPDGYFMYPTSSGDPVRGRSYRLTAARWPWTKSDVLVVGSDGVSWIRPGGQAATISFKECAAALENPDGSLELYGDDGFVVTIVPAAWRQGADAVRRAVAGVPAGRRVFALGEPSLF